MKVNQQIISNKNPIKVEVNRILGTLVDSKSYDISIGIDNYRSKILNYYRNLISGSLLDICKQGKISHALGYDNFGIIINFQHTTELKLHSEDMELRTEIKKLIEIFGVVILRNAFLCHSIENMFHRNNFAHLNFHTDRNDASENCYSLYTRSPFDELQKLPRKASTLFIDNAVAYFQGRIEGIIPEDEIGRRSNYKIFRDLEIDELLGKIILEQPWNEPIGTGEIGIIHNNCVLHSSYKHGLDPGYSIGARYLS